MRIAIAAILIFLMAGVATYIAMSPSGIRYRAGELIPDVAGLDPVMVFGTHLLTAKGPGDAEGLRAAAELGVRTIIGVDTDPPLPHDLITEAETLGIRIVHIPLNYDGIDGPQRIALAKALLDLPSPIMMTCRTGLHLAPSAAAMAMACTGELEAEHAVELMQRAGVSDAYQDLYSAVRDARELDRSVIDSSGPAAFQAAVRPATLHDTMWQIQTSMDEIRMITEHAGEPSAEHPAADADRAAVRIETIFGSLIEEISETRNAGLADEGFADDGYAQLMELAGTEAAVLRASVQSGDWDQAEADHMTLFQTCLACHASYR